MKHSNSVRDAAIDQLKKNHADWSVDELLCHPSDAIQLCRDVRAKLGKRLSDDEICKGLLNGRKQGHVK